MDGILLLGRKSCIQHIKFKIYWMSKPVPAANLKILSTFHGEQKPTWLKFLELKLKLKFLYLNRQGYNRVSTDHGKPRKPAMS